MAKQEGGNILSGKLGGVSFYNSVYGPLARSIAPVSKEKFYKDPKLAGRRDAALEFGKASRLGKLLRQAVAYVLPSVEVGDTNQRLNKLLREVGKQDTVSVRGERGIVAGNAALLKGFNWRASAPVEQRVRVPYAVKLDVAGGSASLSIAGLVPKRDLRMGEGATHAEITLVIAAADTAKDSRVSSSAASGKIALSSGTAVDINLSCDLPAGSGAVWIAGVGVHGYQEVGAQMAALEGGAGFEIVEAGALI